MSVPAKIIGPAKNFNFSFDGSGEFPLRRLDSYFETFWGPGIIYRGYETKNRVTRTKAFFPDETYGKRAFFHDEAHEVMLF